MCTELLGDAIWKTIPKLHSQDGEKDPMVYAKLFSPGTDWKYFITEGEKSGERCVVYGIFVGSGRQYRGQTELDELSEMMITECGVHVSVDVNFSPARLSHLIQH